MKLSRRAFLATTGTAALVSSTACDQLASMGLFPPQGSGDEGPFAAPAADSIDAASHAINRLSFGPRPGDHARVTAMGVDAYIEEQLAPEQIDDAEAEWKVRSLESLDDPIGELFEYREKVLLSELTRATVLRAVMGRRQLHEVMVNFWSDHFNIDISKGDCRWLKAADDRDVIRAHAMGRFPELLRASALSPAMLWYLDGRENKKAGEDERPNENYARELLELHTLGVDGGYTQRDVMEVARCLTGWTVNPGSLFGGKGRVEFKAELHDDGEKEVLGRRVPAGLGEKDLDRVLEIVALHPSTARFIATKLCRRFISDEPPPGAIDAVASEFLDSQGDIPRTLHTLFDTDDFRNARGVKFKRPFRFIVSALRATGAKTNAGPRLLDYLVRMGQSPFQYPTPDGYPDEETPWMGTLLWRWKFATALARNEIKGTKIDGAKLTEQAGGDEPLMAHLLGRRANESEVRAYHESEAGLAMMLASPAFMRC